MIRTSVRTFGTFSGNMQLLRAYAAVQHDEADRRPERARRATPSRRAAATGRSSARSRSRPAGTARSSRSRGTSPSTVFELGVEVADPDDEQRREERQLEVRERAHAPVVASCASAPTRAARRASNAPTTAIATSSAIATFASGEPRSSRLPPSATHANVRGSAPTAVPGRHRAHLQAGEAGAVVDEVVRDRRREPHVEDRPEAALLDETVEALDALGQQMRGRVAGEVARDRHLHHRPEHDEGERDRRAGRRSEEQPRPARQHRPGHEEAQERTRPPG